MPPVAVRILHPEPDPASGPLTRWVADSRATLAEHHRRGFIAAGADDVAIVGGPPDDRSFGDRLRELVAEVGPGGLVVLGSGSIPLATASDRQALVAVAASEARRALANNRYSADVVAIARVETLPDDPGPPRRQRAAALARGGRRLPGRRPAPALAARDRHRRAARPRPRRRRRDARPAATCARLDVAGSAARPRRRRPTRAPSCWWPDGPRRRRWPGWSGTVPPGPGRGSRNAACARHRGSPRGRAHGDDVGPGVATRPAGRRSILGALLDRDGPGSLGDHLGRFGDAAIVDTRVLLAHRLGADEAGWPAAEDRFASDLLLPERIADPWLRAADRVGRGGADPDPARWPHARRPGRPARRSTGRRDAAPWRLTPGLRRDPAPDLDAVGQDDGARRPDPRRDRARRADHVRAVHGARAVRPGRRLLPGRAARPGRDGDFLTAPEAHPIFGAALARARRGAWERLGRPDPFVLREYGAGTGALARGDPRRPRAERPDLAAALRYDPVEVEPRRLEAIAARLAGGGPRGRRSTDRRERRRPIVGRRPRQRGPRRAADAPRRRPATAPARGPRRVARRRVRRRRGRADDAGARRPARRPKAIELARGPARRDLPRARSLDRERGGRPRARRPPAHRLRLPGRRAVRPASAAATARSRPTSATASTTTRTVHVGRQDLTAHVDVTAVERAARRAGLDHLGTTTQAEFLVGLGTEDLLAAIQADPATTLEAYLAVRSALMRLLDPAAMGRFRVMAFGARLAGRTRRWRASRYRLAPVGARPPGPAPAHRTTAIYLLPLDRPARRFATVGHDRRGAAREPARALGARRSPTRSRTGASGLAPPDRAPTARMPAGRDALVPGVSARSRRFLGPAAPARARRSKGVR